MTSNRDVTLAEMIDAMSYLKDDEAFRWFQTSTPSRDGMGAVPGDTLRVTIGQVRKELKSMTTRCGDLS